jgi:curved DNA-binding protein CbpA
MDTLYDLLGALPQDDAESLRTAFRRAVKGAHPDLRPGDPDAAVRFRQIVRANEILCDRDQRAAYDHLLALAQLEKDPAAAHPIAAKIHKIASTVLALSSVSIATVGGYFLFMHMSMALVAPAGSLAARMPAGNIDLTARLSASIAAVSPADAPDPAAVSAFIAKAEGNAASTAAANAMTVASVETENASPPGITLPDPAPNYANFFHARGASAHGNKDLGGTVADSDQPAQLDPKFLASYADRGILFFRGKKDDHGFPDLAPLKRADKPSRPKSLLASAGKPRPDASPKAVPLPQPQPRTAIHVVQPEPWYAAATFQ